MLMSRGDGGGGGDGVPTTLPSGQTGELLGCRRRHRRRLPPATRGEPPATPRDINIGANMDRTIYYFQDRTEYGSYDPICPGYEKLEKVRFPIFPGL